MMTVLFDIIVLTSIWNIGLEIVLSDNMALQDVRKWAQAKQSKWFEPLITCLWCRPSVHSLIGYIAAIGLGMIDKFEWSLIWMYPLVVCGTSTVSGIIWSIYKLIEIKTLYYKHKEQNEYFSLKDKKLNHHLKNKNHGNSVHT